MEFSVSLLLTALLKITSVAYSVATGDITHYISNRMPSHPLYLGDPAQFFTLGVSTLSDFTALPCEGCVGCENRHAGFYNVTKSKNFTKLPCNTCYGGECLGEIGDRCAVGRSMSDFSSWTGYEVKDYAMPGSIEHHHVDIINTDTAKTQGFELFFVCQSTTQGYFDRVNGILGLTTAPTSFLSQMYNARKIDKPRFSICFNENPDLKFVSDHGLVTFGGYDENSLESVMVYAKRLPGYGHRVNIKNIYLQKSGGDTALPYSNLDIVRVTLPSNSENMMTLDSAFPFLTFDMNFEEQFQAMWKQLTGHDFIKIRQELTPTELENMPTLMLELEGAEGIPHDFYPDSVPSLTEDYNILVSVPATHYMEYLVFEDKSFRTRINFDGSGGSIFGLNGMTGHTISYEPDANRIGFAKSKKCIDVARNSDEDWRGSLVGDSTQTSNVAGASQKANVGGFTSTNADDDLFNSPSTTAAEKVPKVEINTGITCVTASCRSLMAMGYVFVGTALAVVYRISRPKDRQDYTALQTSSDEPQIDSHQDDFSSAYRRKPRVEAESMLV